MDTTQAINGSKHYINLVGEDPGKYASSGSSGMQIGVAHI